MNIYELSRSFIDWAFENPHKVKPIHYAIYFFAIEHCNRLGWKDKFGLPSQMVMEAIGVRNWRTYSSGLNELVDFGFIKMVETSRNQYSSNIIAIVKNTKAPTKAQYKALDKALQKHSTKHSQSTYQSTVSINKPLNNITIKQLNNITIKEKENKELLFDSWWNLYAKKTGREKSIEKWLKLSLDEINECLKVVNDYVQSTPDKQFRKDPTTYLNGKHWKDEIIFKQQNNNGNQNNNTAPVNAKLTLSERMAEVKRRASERRNQQSNSEGSNVEPFSDFENVN